MRHIILPLLFAFLIITGCGNGKKSPGDTIIIFHAGSLSVPFKELAQEYEKRNPGVKVLMEPAGSVVCARKITELKKPCDIIASADYFVINELIMPEYADWSIRFATNEIVIAFQEKARYASEIDSTNWMDILLRDDVTFARSDPNSDPCGYRSVFTFKLAERYYRREGLEKMLSSKNTEYIRPKEVDLVALVESNAVDYMFQYKSVAIQHNLNYIELPDYINLGNPEKNYIYNTVSLDITGSSPGSTMTVKGDYINYSLSVLKNAVNAEGAINFVSFLLSPDGMEIFRKNGQDPLIPFLTNQPDKIPSKLKMYLKN
jgi:molybdate/tungstate transport system substrate-binding protein